MQRNVSVGISPDVSRFFLNRNCEEGITYVYSVTSLIRYHLKNLQLEAQVDAFYSPTYKTVAIFVNFDEPFMDAQTQQQTKNLIDAYVKVGIANLEKEFEFRKMRRLRLTIPIVYAFCRKIVY